jgi:hypothetical protein
MPTFQLSIKKPIHVDGVFLDKGISVQVSSFTTNPYNELDKINDAFKRIHGVDLKSGGHLNPNYLEVTNL